MLCKTSTAPAPSRHGGAGGGEQAWGQRGPGPHRPRPHCLALPQGCSEPAGREPRLRDTPEDICFEATANAIALHPARPLLAAGDVDGDVYL